MTEPSHTASLFTLSDFALFGREPGLIAQPQSQKEAQDLVRQSSGKAIVPWGGGCRQHLGYPPECYDVALLTTGLNQIIEYEPADLTLTAQAGVTLAHLQSVLADQGQCLPLEIARPETQTLGGVIATRANSLCRLSGGSVRDLLLGVSVVNGRGEIVKGGGKVVKNVAGYDLPKLYCGSLGTLGLMTEATFKVAPLPETSATVALPLETDHNSEDVLDHLLGSDLAPSFVFLLSPLAASAVLSEAQNAQYVILGFDGNAEAVEWQVNTLGAGRLDSAASVQIRAALRDFALNDSPMTAEFHVLSSQVGAFSRMLEWTARRSGFAAQVATDAALGMMTAHFAPLGEDADWQRLLRRSQRQSRPLRRQFYHHADAGCSTRSADIPVWSPLLPDFGLMARLKETLDPTRMWNPGRFVGKL